MGPHTATLRTSGLVGPRSNAITSTKKITTIVVASLRPLDSRPIGRRGLVSRAGIGMVTAGILALGAGTAAAATVLTAASGSGGNIDAQSLVRAGMAKFAKGDVEGSILDFDAALQSRPTLRPYLWQRGLSLYYVDKFAEGAQQFRDDVAVNPNDTEEAIWAYLCEVKLVGAEEARQKFLKVGRDSRPVMRAAEEAFRTGSGPEGIRQAAGGDENGHAAFYSQLYIALWHESEGEEPAAKDAMLKAVNTEYAKKSGDYMTALARVHCSRRGWVPPGQ